MRYIYFISVITLFIITPLIVWNTSSHPFSDPVWEIVHTPSSSAEMMRTPVPHGWILTYKNLARTMIYIPDEDHEWKLNKL